MNSLRNVFDPVFIGWVCDRGFVMHPKKKNEFDYHLEQFRCFSESPEFRINNLLRCDFNINFFIAVQMKITLAQQRIRDNLDGFYFMICFIRNCDVYLCTERQPHFQSNNSYRLTDWHGFSPHTIRFASNKNNSLSLCSMVLCSVVWFFNWNFLVILFAIDREQFNSKSFCFIKDSQSIE